MQKIPIGIIDKDENNIQKVVALLKNVQNIDSLKLNIHDVLEFPFDNKDFKESMQRAKDVFEAESENIGKVTHFSKKIMFFSTKGGSGNTFIAINFAIALRERTKKEVILFDTNYQLGDIALMLGLYQRN